MENDMIRGIQRKIIHIKDTGSCYFEEAYFVLKRDVSTRISEADMIREASRIVEESLKTVYPLKTRKPSRTYIKTFAAGAGTASLIIALGFLLSVLI